MAPPPPYNLIDLPFMGNQPSLPPGSNGDNYIEQPQGSLGPGIGYLEPLPPMPYNKKQKKQMVLVTKMLKKKER